MPGLILALLCLPAGFAVADATGVRPAGGIVLLGLAVAAVAVARPPLARGLGWLAVVLVCFVLSHVIAGTLGTWGAVTLVAAVAGAAGAVLLRPSTAPTSR